MVMKMMVNAKSDGSSVCWTFLLMKKSVTELSGVLLKLVVW